MEYHREKGLVIQMWCLFVFAPNTDFEEGQSRSVEKKFSVGRVCFSSFIDIFKPFSSTKSNPYASHKNALTIGYR